LKYAPQPKIGKTLKPMGVGTGGAEGTAAPPTFGTGGQAIALAPPKV